MAVAVLTRSYDNTRSGANKHHERAPIHFALSLCNRRILN